MHNFDLDETLAKVGISTFRRDMTDLFQKLADSHKPFAVTDFKLPVGVVLPAVVGDATARALAATGEASFKKVMDRMAEQQDFRRAVIRAALTGSVDELASRNGTVGGS